MDKHGLAKADIEVSIVTSYIDCWAEKMRKQMRSDLFSQSLSASKAGRPEEMLCCSFFQTVSSKRRYARSSWNGSEDWGQMAPCSIVFRMATNAFRCLTA